MEKKVSDRYEELYKACQKYPEIILSSVEEKGGCLNHSKNAAVYVPPTPRAENGFIKKFCL